MYTFQQLSALVINLKGRVEELENKLSNIEKLTEQIGEKMNNIPKLIELLQAEVMGEIKNFQLNLENSIDRLVEDEPTNYEDFDDIS